MTLSVTSSSAPQFSSIWKQKWKRRGVLTLAAAAAAVPAAGAASRVFGQPSSPTVGLRVTHDYYFPNACNTSKVDEPVYFTEGDYPYKKWPQTPEQSTNTNPDNFLRAHWYNLGTFAPPAGSNLKKFVVNVGLSSVYPVMPNKPSFKPSEIRYESYNPGMTAITAATLYEEGKNKGLLVVPNRLGNKPPNSCGAPYVSQRLFVVDNLNSVNQVADRDKMTVSLVVEPNPNGNRTYKNLGDTGVDVTVNFYDTHIKHNTLAALGMDNWPTTWKGLSFETENRLPDAFYNGQPSTLSTQIYADEAPLKNSGTQGAIASRWEQSPAHADISRYRIPESQANPFASPVYAPIAPTPGPTDQPTASPSVGPTDQPPTATSTGQPATPTAGPTQQPTTKPPGIYRLFLQFLRS